MTEKDERDIKLYKDYKSGVEYPALMDKYKLTLTTVKGIIVRVRKYYAYSELWNIVLSSRWDSTIKL